MILILKSTQNLVITIECKGVSSVLILRLPRRSGVSPSSERKETVGCGGGEALGAPLWVALLSVQSEGGWNGMECLVIESGSSPFRSDLIPYIMG
jgi:hypothetical protein